MGSNQTQDKRADLKEKLTLNSIRAKVVFGFFLLAMALMVSWLVVHFTVSEMENIVDRLFDPNPKLTMAEELFGQVVQLEQNQKAKALENPNLSTKELLSGSNELRDKLDTLSYWVADNEQQVQRIDSMQKILDQWDRSFIRYLRLRSQMGNNKDISEKMEELSKLMYENDDVDSSVVTTQKKITTTTYIPEEENEKKEKEDKKGKSFWGKLFGKDDTSIDEEITSPHKIVKEETDITIDTIPTRKTDTLFQQVAGMMDEIKKDQTDWNLRLIRQEYLMLHSSGKLIRGLLKLSHDIQEEEVRQEKMVNKSKSNLLQKGIIRYSLLIFVLFVGSAIIVFLVFIDVSKSNHYRKRLNEAKEEAEHLSKARQRFLANMSHEIRTPLQSIIGFSEQLVRYREKIDQKKINAIFHASHHLLHVVNEVLDYSKIESNRFQLNNQPFDMGKELYEVIMAVSQQCDQKGIVFNHMVDLDSLKGKYFHGDAFRLKQILYNLLGNAVKFTDHGEITFETMTDFQPKGCSFIFKIADSGIGISEEDQHRIFEQFEQLETNLTPQDGNGLGLSIVQTLVKEKGGTIELMSRPGYGSTFMVKLFYPFAEEPMEFKLSANELPEKGKTPDKVIIVDDDQLIRELCEIILSRNGISYYSFASAEEFLAKDLTALRGQLVFLIDMRLPGMSGKELSTHIQKEFKDIDFRLVIMTAQLIGDEYTHNEGIDDILMKPFTEDQLMMVLKKQLLSTKIENEPVLKNNDVPDLSNLFRMVGQDLQLVQSYIERFQKDFMTDKKHLLIALDKGDFATSVELIHRLAGRCGQLGSHALAADFRKLEALLRSDGVKMEQYLEKIHEAIRRLERMLDHLKVEIPEEV